MRAGYKQTEVGEIPEDWCITNIGELNPYITSGSRGWADYYSRDGSPFIRITNMSRECINLDLSRLRYVNLPSNENEGKRTELKDGDLLISITADIGISSYVDSKLPKPAYINQHVSLVRLDPSTTNSKFVSYFLASEGVQKLFLGSTDQGAKAGLNLDAIRKIEIAQPTIDEQGAIAKALSDVDELIVSLEKLIAKKRDIKTATMQQLLTGKKRLPGFGEGKGYKQTELGEIPKDWDVRPLGESAVFINGRAYGIHEWETQGVPVIRLQNLTGRGENYYFSNLKLPEKQYCNNGDLLFMWSATFGPVIWFGEKAIYHYHIWKIECAAYTDKKFLYYKLDEMTENLKRGSSSGGTMLHVTKEKMEVSTIACPPFNEQKAISHVLSDIDIELSGIESRLEKTKAIKQGMMQELLTGRTRLVDVAVTSKSKVA